MYKPANLPSLNKNPKNRPMKQIIQYAIAGFLILALLGTERVFADDEYERVTILDLNTYEETPQVTSDFPEHPMVGDQIEIEVIVLSNPRSSGLSNFDAEDGSLSRIHFFVVDVAAKDEGKEGMYMHVVATDVETFETLERGDHVTLRGTHDFFGNTVQFDPDEEEWMGNVIGDPEYVDLLEPMTISLDDLNMEYEEGSGTYTFRPEAYEDYINAYVKFEGVEVIGSDLDDGGRPNFYWVNENGIPAWTRDVSLRYRNDRNDVEGGYRDGYNYRRVEAEGEFDADGPFRPPQSGSIIDVSGFVVWDGFDFYNLNESDDHSTLQVAPIEDGVLWWGEGDDVERLTHDPNDSRVAWPNDLRVVAFPPVISNYSISETQPGEGEQVEISANLAGQEGEVAYDVRVAYETSRGDEGIAEMVDEGDGNYSYTFDEFDPFTSVSFQILAKIDAEDNGETITLEGRFSDGDIDQAGNVLDMRFTQVGDVIDQISLIQTTVDRQRGPSPLELAGVDTLDNVSIDIDAVVVSTSESGFVVVHDAAEAWSGIPLAASEEVADLELGESINITGASIENDFDNVYLDNVEFQSQGLIGDFLDNLGDHIPTVTPAEATANSGAAYEGMVIHLVDVLASDNQADAPSDFGEWAIASQADPEGAELRINNFPSFGPVTGDFSTTVPNELNAHIRVGAEFDDVYGFSSYSFGNPKIHLRSLDDLVTEESYTWPKRDVSLFAINTVNEDEESAGPGGVVVDVDNEATLQESVSYDGDEVSYRFALNAAGDEDFDEPLIEVDDYEVENDTVRFFISSEDLIAAFEAAELETDESGEFIWTVFFSDGESEVQYSSKDGAEFIASYETVTMGYGEVVQSPVDPDTPQTVELNQNYPNPFNPVTNIEYQVPEQSDVLLTVYDVLGRQVAVLVNEEQSAGSYTVSFDGSQLSSGMYIYRLEAGSTAITKQMMLVK